MTSGSGKASDRDLLSGVLAGDRASLARAITLVESTRADHRQQACELLDGLPERPDSWRIGISGPPGAGKSTFLDAFGMELIDSGHRVAVLAVDPSSSLSGGSILGDKTRMERLAREPAAFIRPSPSAGNLGGVGRRTREAIRVCEAAGFDRIFVETVGVGQSEGLVRTMVDVFLLLLLPGSGDSLQGIKRGIMELADGLFINKADGESRSAAERTANDYGQALHLLPPATEGWSVPVGCISALEAQGLNQVLECLVAHRQHLETLGGGVERHRREQALDWLRTMVQDELLTRFWNRPGIRELLAELEHGILEQGLDPVRAADRLLSR
ncbi:MAG: methylmalonyl Co-A mutase-associated GTPase MeaB [Candidatus Cloacimonetes bacterium]|nr:methylmalonyl Co-A mutase-associated GTPase MeaB [Candidatus Cloacimonadota bacterium]